MTLRERLEKIWNSEGCLCPNHLVRWNEKGHGYAKGLNLFYTRGTRRVRGRKSKSKGYSFLSKWYGLYWRLQ